MKKVSNGFRVLTVTILFLGITLALCGTTYAAWHCTHGHSGHVQNELILISPYQRYGWGLDFTQNSGTSNWVQLHVNGPGPRYGAQGIRLKFWLESNDTWVDQIDVYNGNNLVKTITGNWRGPGWHDIRLGLGSLISFDRGLGISIKTNVGVEQMGNRFVFSGACANFRKLP